MGLGNAHAESTKLKKPTGGSGFASSSEAASKEDSDVGHFSPRSGPGTRRGPSRIIINAREVGLKRYDSLVVRSQTAATLLVHRGDDRMGLRQRTAAVTNGSPVACINGADVTVLELG